MRNKLLIFSATLLGCLAVVFGIRAVSLRVPRPEVAPTPSVLPLDDTLALSDRRLRAAQNQIKQSPSDPRGYNHLCAAYMKKARETGDFNFNARAEAALNQSLEVKPDNYEAIKLRAALLLVYHRFSEALEVAHRAQRMQPNDADNYGALTDALVELGRYEAAFESAQKMVDLRPDATSYARASYLRALHGDTKGAIQAMRFAADAAQDAESAAWCRVHLGDELMNAGELAAAEHEFDIALHVFPGYHLALAAKARARLARGDADSAIEFYKQAQHRVPLPETAVALGDLYAYRGDDKEARRQYQLFEFIEQAASPESRTYSRNIALFWADHDIKLDEALAVARRERAERADIFTSDVLAWCLYKKGYLAEAKASIDEALQLGTRDARIFYHAGMIHHRLDDHRTAGKYLKLALEINPTFDILQAYIARQTLRSMMP